MLSLYRRHRPRTFDQVVGQESVVRTLRNAVELGKVHHAYLFVGSRGTGKTSMAKLLACALNAEGGPRSDFSPEDPACRAIMAGNSLDVVEMDAASNNSVDDVRELRENVALAPMGGARRVYILDEAHMLTTAAWNAFLKTLEEPPPHVVFVLATTEAHKVPATIIDRCHRFTFARPSLEQIAGVLRRVADEEGIAIPDAAVGMIARKAGGSFRDALGTLEQLVTYGGNEIALEDVLQTLGVASPELLLEATEALVEREPRNALDVVQQLVDSGRDYEQFMRDLAGHLRHLFVLQTMGEVPDSFASTAEHAERLVSQSERLSSGEVVRVIDLLAAALAAVKDGSEPRLQLEVALLKATQPQADQSLQALMFRIDQLEARLGQVGASSAPPPAGRGPAGTTPRGRSSPPPETIVTAREGVASAEPVGARAPAEAVAAHASAEAAARASAVSPPPGRAPRTATASAPAPAAAAVRPATSEPTVPSPSEAPRRPLAVGGAAAAVLESADPEGGVELSQRVPGEDLSLDLEQVQAVWSGVADAVREQNAMVGALLAEAVPVALEEDRLTVAFPQEAAFLKKKAEANRELVLGALRSLTGRPLVIGFELADRREQSVPRTLGEDELLERLKRDFAAEEVFEDDQPDTED